MSDKVRAVETVDMMIEDMMVHIIHDDNAGERRSKRLSFYERKTKREIVRHAGHTIGVEEEA